MPLTAPALRLNVLDLKLSPTRSFQVYITPRHASFNAGILETGEPEQHRQPNGALITKPATRFTGIRTSLWRNFNPDTSLRGVEMALHANDSKHVKGVQLSLGRNLAEMITGVQIALHGNIAEHAKDLLLQLAGSGNEIKGQGQAHALQFAGVFNSVPYASFTGGQFATCFNFLNRYGNQRAVQGALLGNMVGYEGDPRDDVDFKGVQLAGLYNGMHIRSKVWQLGILNTLVRKVGGSLTRFTGFLGGLNLGKWLVGPYFSKQKETL